jgi:uncharacterized protein (TIGR00251 family)
VDPGVPTIVQFEWGVELDVRVIPRAAHADLGGVREGALVVRLTAPPVEGAANAALTAFLAERLSLPRRAIRIIAGEHGRRKRVAIDGVTAAAIRRTLAS